LKADHDLFLKLLKAQRHHQSRKPHNELALSRQRSPGRKLQVGDKAAVLLLSPSHVMLSIDYGGSVEVTEGLGDVRKRLDSIRKN
jgi:hypothetical protein